MAKVKPLKASDIAKAKKKVIPDAVIESFNEVIAKRFSDGYARVDQEEVVKLIVGKGIEREELFENYWLDVEPIFERAGWTVEYDKPGYNESYGAYFIFTAGRMKRHLSTARELLNMLDD